ncbi:MAG: 7,8-didemethyl-8-hydroxy-5-deazariboflavin synthase subunit CofG [Armatimonadetes bacterium]|nr:7,8-didemethyl-8-hydroxy-5-deazariboflavin synthase subunit CofG [Armatimonadota bacterium]
MPSLIDTPTRILARVLEGGRLSIEDGVALMGCGRAEFPALLHAASVVRDRGMGDARWVTYSRKVFIPLTNLCRDVCGYCTFARSEKDPLAHTMTPEQVLAVARAGQAAGCKEALFSLGERPEERYPSVREALRRLGYSSTTEYLAAMCDLVFRETGLLPHSNCGILTRDELEILRPHNASMGLMLENVSERLLERGQAHWACPGKAPELRLQTIRDAADLGVAFTSGILIGIGETLEERVASLAAIRALSEETGAVQEVIIQNFRAKMDTKMRAHGEPSALDMARTIAVARLMLGPEMSVQAPPNLTPDAYGFYLLAGINDWGGISPVTRDHINPEAAWPEVREVSDITVEAGFALRERLALYPRYLGTRFMRERFAGAIAAWTDESGLVRC